MLKFSNLQIYVKNFTLSIKEEFSPYGIYVQLVTPMYVRTKMNNYSTTVSAGGILVPDVESFTKSAVFSIGRTSETTGYWTHGIQVNSPPIFLLFDIRIQLNKPTFNFRSLVP